MDRRSISLFILALLLLALATSLYGQRFLFSSQRYASTVEAAGDVGVYWDENCTQATSSIDWGTLSPGMTNHVTVYARNEGNETMLLAITALDWNPQNASSFITFSWSSQDNTITPEETVKVDLALSLASSSQPGFSTCSFDLAVQGTASPTSLLLSIASAHGSPSPPVGDNLYDNGSSVTCSATSPAVEGGVSYTCTGWSGTGSVPSTGSGTSVTFIISQDSTITWNWAITEWQLIVSSAHGSPSPCPGAYTYDDGSSVTCSVASPAVEDGVSYACTGWTGTGSAPSAGSGTSVTFTITQDSSINWNWQTQPVLDEVAITNVTYSKIFIAQGYNTSFTLFAENEGMYTETFNVTLYANDTIINTQIVTVAAGNSIDLNFVWNTSGFAYGNYTISASASLVLGQTDMTDNNVTAGVVQVTIPGDITGDSQVSLSDLVALANAYGSKPGDPRWNPNADIDGDGTVDLFDLVILAQHYGQTYP